MQLRSIGDRGGFGGGHVAVVVRTCLQGQRGGGPGLEHGLHVERALGAAFRRAGMLRVFDLRELFDCAETLGRLKSPPGKRLAILTNGGGIGVLAIDRLVELGGISAEIGPDAKAKLDAVLPRTWSGSNPVDIVGDADAARYAAALEILLSDSANDAVLAAAAGVTARRHHKVGLVLPQRLLGIARFEDVALLGDAAGRFGATVLVATHSAEAAAIAQTRIQLRDGRIATVERA